MENDYKPWFGSPISPWFRWFAWRPVETVDRGWRWLVVVNRRRIQKNPYLDGGSDFWNQYAVQIKRGTP
jgi:hypothetical protein